MAIQPLRIAITGAAGQIAYQFIFRVATGELFGQDQPIIFHLIEIPEMLPSLEGIKMELEDCANPRFHSIHITSDLSTGFKDIDYAILIGAQPRGPGMERKDLIHINKHIFAMQGKALNEHAHPKVKVFVIGNPSNTNCLILMHHAPRLLRKNFFSLMRLDQNRATTLLAKKAGVTLEDVSDMIIWGNHSTTQVPDFTHARIKGELAEKVIDDRKWLENDFIEIIQKRGAEVIKARGKSSAASAAHAIIDAIRDTLHPSPCFSTGVDSTGNPYGIQDNLIFSFPCKSLPGGDVKIIDKFKVGEFLEKKLKITEKELLEERDVVKDVLGAL